jgi:amidase
MTTSSPHLNDTLDAFCTDTEAYLEGASGGPLSGLTFAAKDIFDVKGHVTGGGNPDWKATHPPAEHTAWIVQTLADAGATMVGKTHTDELTRGILGENAHYGTPVNPRAPGRVPGGSSSGSAAAVAGGLVDFALGSDTGGSVRIPASFCGLYGLRPTHNRIPLDGILLQAPSYDTIGWFARDAATFARVGMAVFGNTITPATPGRVVIAEDLFAECDPIVAAALRPVAERLAGIAPASETVRLAPDGVDGWAWQQNTLQSIEAWKSVADWIDAVNPRFSYMVTERYALGTSFTQPQIEAARATRDAARGRLNEVLADGSFLCFPTSPVVAPLRGQPLSGKRASQGRIIRLTCMGGTTGRPQLSLPLGEADGLPVGLSLMGNRGDDEALIGFALEIERELAQ